MQGIGQINKYLLPKQKKNDEFRIIRTAKGTLLQNSQKYVLSYTRLNFFSLQGFMGGFQLLDLIIPELKSHVIPYKFKCSHWWKIHL